MKPPFTALLVLAVAGCCAAWSPAQAQARPERRVATVPEGVQVPAWNELSPDQRRDLAHLAQRWDQLPASRRVAILERWQRWRALPPAQRETLRRRLHGWLGRTDEDEPDPIDSAPDLALDPLGEQVRREQWEALGRSLRQLPRRQRECFLLRELQGLSVAETAAAMGCSEGSVKTHLSRALAALRQRMEAWQ